MPTGSGTKEDPWIGQYKIDTVQDMGALQLGPNTFTKYLLALTNEHNQQKQNIEMLRKPQSPAPQAGPNPVLMQVWNANGFTKCKFAPANQGGAAPAAQGGGGAGYTAGAGAGSSDEERNRSIVMQVSVKAAAEILSGTADANPDNVLMYAEHIANGVLAFAKRGAPAPPPQAAPPAPAAPPQQQAWGASPAQQSFPAAQPQAQGGFGGGGDPDIPFAFPVERDLRSHDHNDYTKEVI